jgi:general secretion pathway protein M
MSFIDKFRAWLDTLAERERRLVIWGGIGAAVVLFFGVLVIPLHAAASNSAERVARKQDDLAWMRSVAPELRAAGPVNDSGGSLVVVIDQTARAVGLGSALSGSQPSGSGGIRVRLDGAPFDTLVGWLAQLQQQHGIHVESATVDRTATSGMVNASLILKKAG